MSLESITPENVDIPPDPIVSLALPPVCILTSSAVGNPIVVLGSPMCLIALAISMVLPLNVAIPVTSNPSPTKILFSTPRPPSRTNEPVSLLVD